MSHACYTESFRIAQRACGPTRRAGVVFRRRSAEICLEICDCFVFISTTDPRRRVAGKATLSVPQTLGASGSGGDVLRSCVNLHGKHPKADKKYTFNAQLYVHPRVERERISKSSIVRA